MHGLITRILFVEEESEVPSDFEDYLNALGFEIVGNATDGKTGVIKTAELKPDVVLMEISLKKKYDGIKFADEIKENFDIPVVYLADHPDEIAVNRSRLKYPYFYLIKPFSKNDFIKTVKLAIEKYKIELNLKRREKILKIEKELAFELSESSDLNEILKISLDAVITVSGMDSGGIYLIDDITGDLLLKVHHGLSKDFVDSVTIYKADSYNARIIMKGQPLYTNYQKIKADLPESQIKEKLRAFISIPIKYNGKVIANLNLASHTIDEIPYGNKKALESILSQIGGVISRAKAELDLLESKKFTEKILYSISDGLAILDKKGFFLDVNPSLCKMTGYSRDELVGTGIPHPFWPKEDIKKIQSSLEKILKGKLNEKELNFQKKNGEYFSVIINPSIITDDKGKTRAVISTIKDISKRKKLEIALKESEEKYKNIIETMQEGVWIIDNNSTTTYVNQQMAEIFGYSVDEMIGKHVFSFVYEEDRKLAQIELNKNQDILKRKHEFRFKNKQGNEIWVMISTNSMKNKRGEFSGTLGIMSKINKK